MAQTSSNVGMSAKEYAKKQLGDLDLSYLNAERDNAQNTYNTSKNSLETNFNNLINQINSNREDTRKNFNIGRATISENAYNANRANQLDLASRVTGTSGLKGLGEVGNRIETGQQYSNLANNYYKDMADLDTNERQGRSQYELDLQNIKNTLDSSLADIGSRESEAKNNYNLTLGQLAEGIQGRWDSNENAEKQLAQAKAAAAQAHRDAVNAAKSQLTALKKQSLADIVNNSNLSNDQMIARIQSTFGVDSTMAQNVLRQLGVMEKGTPIAVGSNILNYAKGYDDSVNYLNQLTGGY